MLNDELSVPDAVADVLIMLSSSLTASAIRILLVLLQKFMFILSCDACFLSFILDVSFYR